MKFDELKIILKRLYKEYVKKHLKRILVALVLSLIVAASTSGIAWLLDPAVKKIYIEQNKVFAWTINKNEEMKHLINMGVDGIMTDNISSLKKILIKKNLW